MFDADKKTETSIGKVVSYERASEELCEEEYERLLVSGLAMGDEKAYKLVFDYYYRNLCNFANNYLGSQDASRDIVQDVFVNIWSNRKQFQITHSLKAYLYQAVRNHSLNYLKKHSKTVELTHENRIIADSYIDPEHNNSFERLMAVRIWEIAEELPEKRKAVFILHRKHGLSYKEIAKVMEIKRKTVENQMARALKYIRERLNS